MSNGKTDKGNLDLDVINLSKTFVTQGDELRVFEKLSFTIERGKLVAFVGPSGCGKSTLLRILSGAEGANFDKLFIDPERMKTSASIEQTPALFPWRTAFQNAHIGVEIRKARNRRMFSSEELDDNAMNNSVRDDFKLFGLMGAENKYPAELSGGMQQRVAIIRALQSNPGMLFCDEPFSAIDFVTRLYLNTEFKKISQNIGCTTLFVTHNIEEAIFLADRILVLNGSPCRIVLDREPRLTVYPEDAVKCRQSPEFPILFQEIWDKLKPTV
jgi:NitT/TauT family transport system ATP-binding protein